MNEWKKVVSSSTKVYVRSRWHHISSSLFGNFLNYQTVSWSDNQSLSLPPNYQDRIHSNVQQCKIQHASLYLFFFFFWVNVDDPSWKVIFSFKTFNYAQEINLCKFSTSFFSKCMNLKIKFFYCILKRLNGPLMTLYCIVLVHRSSYAT